MIRKRNYVLMSALSALMSAGAAALSTIEKDAKLVVESIEIKLHLKHVETKQEVKFDSPEAADNFKSNVSDPDKWQPAAQVDAAASTPMTAPTTAPDAPLAPPMTLDQIVGDTSIPAMAEPAAANMAPATVAAPAGVTDQTDPLAGLIPAQHIEVDLDQLRASVTADTAATATAVSAPAVDGTVTAAADVAAAPADTAAPAPIEAAQVDQVAAAAAVTTDATPAAAPEAAPVEAAAPAAPVEVSAAAVGDAPAVVADTTNPAA